MSGFTKLVPDLIQSSIWNESSDVRCVWITMLATKDENGYVRGDINTLTRLSNVPRPAVEEAVLKFSSPDPSSHTPDNEGRRIEEAPGGWLVLNHHLYRDGDRREYFREYMRKRRAVKGVNVNSKHCSVSVSDSVSGSEGGTGGTWRDSLAVYQSEATEAVADLLNDQAWVEEREKYHPGLDVRLSVQKAHVDFWGTEAGWAHKRGKRTQTINWRSTYNQALSMKSNQVWAPRQSAARGGLVEIAPGVGEK